VLRSAKDHFHPDPRTRAYADLTVHQGYTHRYRREEGLSLSLFLAIRRTSDAMLIMKIRLDARFRDHLLHSHERQPNYQTTVKRV
jgi:hypothetical protein